MSKEPKETEVKKETTTGMPPTPEKLTSTGAPVDERFTSPPQIPDAVQKPEPKEDDAKRRPPKSEDDDKDDEEGSSKRRR